MSRWNETGSSRNSALPQTQQASRVILRRMSISFLVSAEEFRHLFRITPSNRCSSLENGGLLGTEATEMRYSHERT